MKRLAISIRTSANSFELGSRVGFGWAIFSKVGDKGVFSSGLCFLSERIGTFKPGLAQGVIVH